MGPCTTGGIASVREEVETKYSRSEICDHISLEALRQKLD